MTTASEPTWIATRRLTTEDGKPVDASMAAPVEVSDHEWRCAIRLRIDGQETPFTVHTCDHVIGVDAFQAIEGALIILGRELEARRCAWFRESPAWTGFSHLVNLDPEIMDVPRLVRRIDEELAREMEAALWRRHRAKKEGTYTPSASQRKWNTIVSGLRALHAYAFDDEPYDDAATSAWHEAADDETFCRPALARIRAAANDGERRKLSAQLLGKLEQPQKLATEQPTPERKE